MDKQMYEHLKRNISYCNTTHLRSVMTVVVTKQKLGSIMIESLLTKLGIGGNQTANIFFKLQIINITIT